MINRLGATHFGVWAIKHIASPLQRWFYQLTGGKFFTPGDKKRNILLLTTTGRRTGKERTTPMFFLRDEDRLVICNVNPGFENTNPWVLNLRANPNVKAQVGSEILAYHAREVVGEELARYWPQLVEIWPAYQEHYSRSGKRAIFVLEQALPEKPGS